MPEPTISQKSAWTACVSNVPSRNCCAILSDAETKSVFRYSIDTGVGTCSCQSSIRPAVCADFTNPPFDILHPPFAIRRPSVTCSFTCCGVPHRKICSYVYVLVTETRRYSSTTKATLNPAYGMRTTTTVIFTGTEADFAVEIRTDNLK